MKDRLKSVMWYFVLCGIAAAEGYVLYKFGIRYVFNLCITTATMSILIMIRRG